MPTLISIEECLRKGIINSGDCIDPTGCFLSSNKKVILSSKDTGYNNKQIFIREHKLKWFLIIENNETPILIGEPTEFKLYLYGYKGFKFTHEALNRICSVYSNRELNMYARSCKVEDIQLWRRNNDIINLLNKNTTEIWLDTPFREYGMYGTYISKGIFTQRFSFLKSKCLSQLSSKSLRPVIELRDTKSIFVNLESFEEKECWELSSKPKK